MFEDFDNKKALIEPSIKAFLYINLKKNYALLLPYIFSL